MRERPDNRRDVHEDRSYCCAGAAELDLGHQHTKGTCPEIKTGFPTKQACEQAAAKWRANFETQVKEGTIRTDTDRRRRLARAIPSTKCIEDAKIPPVNPLNTPRQEHDSRNIMSTRVLATLPPIPSGIQKEWKLRHIKEDYHE